MFKMGGFYITSKGRLVKLFNQFAFADGFVINAAICQSNGGGWVAVRYKLDGTCNLEAADNKISPDNGVGIYANYMTFSIWFDRLANQWRGRATDAYGQIIVDLANLDGYERAMKLILLGAEQKLLSWMQDAGYDEGKELVNE